MASFFMELFPALRCIFLAYAPKDATPIGARKLKSKQFSYPATPLPRVSSRVVTHIYIIYKKYPLFAGLGK